MKRLVLKYVGGDSTASITWNIMPTCELLSNVARCSASWICLITEQFHFQNQLRFENTEKKIKTMTGQPQIDLFYSYIMKDYLSQHEYSEKVNWITWAFANIGHQPSPTRHFFVTSKFSMFSVSYTAFSLLTWEGKISIMLNMHSTLSYRQSWVSLNTRQEVDSSSQCN